MSNFQEIRHDWLDTRSNRFWMVIALAIAVAVLSGCGGGGHDEHHGGGKPPPSQVESGPGPGSRPPTKQVTFEYVMEQTTLQPGKEGLLVRQEIDCDVTTSGVCVNAVVLDGVEIASDVGLRNLRVVVDGVEVSDWWHCHQFPCFVPLEGQVQVYKPGMVIEVYGWVPRSTKSGTQTSVSMLPSVQTSADVFVDGNAPLITFAWPSGKHPALVTEASRMLVEGVGAGVIGWMKLKDPDGAELQGFKLDFGVEQSGLPYSIKITNSRREYWWFQGTVGSDGIALTVLPNGASPESFAIAAREEVVVRFELGVPGMGGKLFRVLEVWMASGGFDEPPILPDWGDSCGLIMSDGSDCKG